MAVASEEQDEGPGPCVMMIATIGWHLPPSIHPLLLWADPKSWLSAPHNRDMGLQ